MARTNLKTISVYATEEQQIILAKAAARHNRSLSNYLIDLGLRDAEQEGLATQGQVNRASDGRRVASS